MKISRKDWQKYITLLRKVSNTAADKVAKYMDTIDINSEEGMRALLDYSYAVATRYGEGATALACQMYDEIASLSGASVPIAEPAATATYGEVAMSVRGKMMDTLNPDAIGAKVGLLVRRAGMDTTLHNAIRDGAEWAWIPSGDTCPFCLILASNGWQEASDKVLKGNHAEHIHANCDCSFVVRFDNRMDVEGYDPEALYDEYMGAAEGNSTAKLNALRRRHYAANRGHINAQKRAAYAKRVEKERYFGKGKSITVNLKEIEEQNYRMKFRGVTANTSVDDAVCKYSRQILKNRSGTYQEDLVLLDADTGKHIFTLDTGGADRGVNYNDELNDTIKRARSEGIRILAIHNHPSSLPPSIDDGVSALNHGYDIGVVACHDGTVYTYTAAKYALTEKECRMLHNAIAYQIKTGASIEDVWYNMLNEYGMEVQRR